MHTEVMMPHAVIKSVTAPVITSKHSFRLEICAVYLGGVPDSLRSLSHHSDRGADELSGKKIMSHSDLPI